MGERAMTPEGFEQPVSQGAPFDGKAIVEVDAVLAAILTASSSTCWAPPAASFIPVGYGSAGKSGMEGRGIPCALRTTSYKGYRASCC